MKPVAEDGAWLIRWLLIWGMCSTWFEISSTTSIKIWDATPAFSCDCKSYCHGWFSDHNQNFSNVLTSPIIISAERSPLLDIGRCWGPLGSPNRPFLRYPRPTLAHDLNRPSLHLVGILPSSDSWTPLENFFGVIGQQFCEQCTHPLPLEPSIFPNYAVMAVVARSRHFWRDLAEKLLAQPSPSPSERPWASCWGSSLANSTRI